MTDAFANGLTPAEEDPILDRYLSLVPAAVPTAGFDERVLSSVWRPAPRWVRRTRAAVNDLTASGRGWLLIGALAVGSLLPLAAALVTARMFADSIGDGLRWFAAEGLPFAWVAVTQDVAWVTAEVASLLGAHGVSQGELVAAGIGAALGMLGCALGLRRTMTPSRKSRP